jgi:hypothetical protein
VGRAFEIILDERRHRSTASTNRSSTFRALPFCARVGIDDDQRDANDFVVEELLLAQGPVAPGIRRGPT